MRAGIISTELCFGDWVPSLNLEPFRSFSIPLHRMSTTQSIRPATAFEVINDTVTTSGSPEMENFISLEVQHLAPWFRKIARRLNYSGQIKLVHRDGSGVIACELNEKREGSGARISLKGSNNRLVDPGIQHSMLLTSL